MFFFSKFYETCKYFTIIMWTAINLLLLILSYILGFLSSSANLFIEIVLYCEILINFVIFILLELLIRYVNIIL